jgi:mannose-6-phosphate isomerase, type 2 / mannose-1-phosphate guanylyltransferase (GDP)
MKILLLSGGSGQRLWPLSNDYCSKQYIKVLSGDDGRQSMLQRVFSQLKSVGKSEDAVIIASEAQKDIIYSQLGSETKIAFEPSRKDTFPAILLGCSWLYEQGSNDDEIVVVMPVDPYVERDYFENFELLAKKLTESGSDIALMGAIPSYPSEKYGYIIPGEKKDGYFEIKGFKEKPYLEEAEQLLKQNALWNCGVFCFKLGLMKKYCLKYDFDFSYSIIKENYEKLPTISFDYEVLEKSGNKIAIEYSGTWKDIGTWNTLTEEMDVDSIGDVYIDDASSSTHVVNTLDIPLIVMGADNLIVSATYDGILVADKDRSSHLKDSLGKIKISPRYEERRWGTIKTIDRSEEDGIGVCTNKVQVASGKYTSYHRHTEHAEVITILSGEGLLVTDECILKLTPGISVTIEANKYHAIKGIKEMVYIEILLGNLERDDIERTLHDWDDIMQNYFEIKGRLK